MSFAARAVAGALALVLLVDLGYLGTRAALGAFRDRYELRVVLGELGLGVVSGTDVKMRGVVVGRVAQVELDEDLRAVATLHLDPGNPVPERADFLVTGKTLLGEKQIEIRFDGPFDRGPFLADGAVVADPGRVVEFEDVLAHLSRLFGAIEPEDLAVVVDDFFGAFDGQGPVIARAVDEGARAASTFVGTLDDQVASTRALALVMTTLADEGDDFNRLGRAIAAGLPTLSDNEGALQVALDALGRFSDELEVTLRVTRPDIDRMMVQGDSVTRLLAVYAPEVGELVSGLVAYTAKYGVGFRNPGVTGQAAYFQIILEGVDLEAAICEGLPPELRDRLPGCAADSTAGATGAAETPQTNLRLPPELLAPDVPERLDVLEPLRRALTAPVVEGGRG